MGLEGVWEMRGGGGEGEGGKRGGGERERVRERQRGLEHHKERRGSGEHRELS